MNSDTVGNKTKVDACVLIPCFNNQEGLLKSLHSIFYTQGKLWVVVVDDGSSVPVQKEAIASEDFQYPIQVIRLDRNEGITHALNAGLEWIEEHLQAKYIARLDCGDICHPDRFYKQVSFLDHHPAIGLLGTWCTFQDPNTSFNYSYTTPTEHAAIVSEMHLRNVFIHPTVMFRSDLVQETGNYPIDYPYVEDYALFSKMLHKSRGAVLSEFLVICELNPKGISMSNRQKQLIGRRKVVSDYGVFPVKKFIGKVNLLIMCVLPYKWVLFVKDKLS